MCNQSINKPKTLSLRDSKEEYDKEELKGGGGVVEKDYIKESGTWQIVENGKGGFAFSNQWSRWEMMISLPIDN